jgi:hypothetical protein
MFHILDVNPYQSRYQKILLRSIKSYIRKQYLQENTIRNIRILKTQNNLYKKCSAQQALIELLGALQKAERKKVIIKTPNVNQAII